MSLRDGSQLSPWMWTGITFPSLHHTLSLLLTRPLVVWMGTTMFPYFIPSRAVPPPVARLADTRRAPCLHQLTFLAPWRSLHHLTCRTPCRNLHLTCHGPCLSPQTHSEGFTPCSWLSRASSWRSLQPRPSPAKISWHLPTPQVSKSNNMSKN